MLDTCDRWELWEDGSEHHVIEVEIPAEVALRRWAALIAAQAEATRLDYVEAASIAADAAERCPALARQMDGITRGCERIAGDLVQLENMMRGYLMLTGEPAGSC